MPDEHTQWERVSTQPSEKEDFHARQRTDEVRRVRLTENPYQDEAVRDRLLLRWALIVFLMIILIAVLAWQVFFT